MLVQANKLILTMTQYPPDQANEFVLAATRLTDRLVKIENILATQGQSGIFIHIADPNNPREARYEPPENL